MSSNFKVYLFTGNYFQHCIYTWLHMFNPVYMHSYEIANPHFDEIFNTVFVSQHISSIMIACHHINSSPSVGCPAWLVFATLTQSGVMLLKNTSHSITGPVRDWCWQHRPSTALVLTNKSLTWNEANNGATSNGHPFDVDSATRCLYDINPRTVMIL